MWGEMRPEQGRLKRIGLHLQRMSTTRLSPKLFRKIPQEHPTRKVTLLRSSPTNPSLTGTVRPDSSVREAAEKGLDSRNLVEEKYVQSGQFVLSKATPFRSTNHIQFTCGTNRSRNRKTKSKVRTKRWRKTDPKRRSICVLRIWRI